MVLLLLYYLKLIELVEFFSHIFMYAGSTRPSLHLSFAEGINNYLKLIIYLPIVYNNNYYLIKLIM